MTVWGLYKWLDEVWGVWREGGVEPVASAASIFTHPTPAYHGSRSRGVWEMGCQPPAL